MKLMVKVVMTVAGWVEVMVVVVMIKDEADGENGDDW